MSVNFFNVEEFKNLIKTKKLDELLQMRDDLFKEMQSTEKLLNCDVVITDLPFALVDDYKEMSLLMDEIATKSYLVFSGVNKKYFETNDACETQCPRCKQKSKKIRYCPYCGFLKI